MTGHEGRDGELRYNSNFPFTSALDWVVSQRQDPAALPPGKTQYPLYWRLGWSHGRSGQVGLWKIFPHRDSIL
jgi:hypothetical protein